MSEARRSVNRKELRLRIEKFSSFCLAAQPFDSCGVPIRRTAQLVCRGKFSRPEGQPARSMVVLNGLRYSFRTGWFFRHTMVLVETFAGTVAV